MQCQHVRDNKILRKNSIDNSAISADNPATINAMVDLTTAYETDKGQHAAPVLEGTVVRHDQEWQEDRGVQGDQALLARPLPGP